MEIWKEELYHHGILGMSWGKRNGPPYPLGANKHSAAEKKAGWLKSIKPSYRKSELKRVKKNKKGRDYSNKKRYEIIEKKIRSKYEFGQKMSESDRQKLKVSKRNLVEKKKQSKAKYVSEAVDINKKYVKNIIKTGMAVSAIALSAYGGYKLHTIGGFSSSSFKPGTAMLKMEYKAAKSIAKSLPKASKFGLKWVIKHPETLTFPVMVVLMNNTKKAVEKISEEKAKK